jgi:ectoine hydroxylase-related dioxygenase (phytanoyl-CoA dioxygenase family)
MRNLLRDPELNDRCRDQGYIILPFLDAPEIDQLREAFAEMHPENLPVLYISALNGDAEYRKAAGEAIRVVFEPKIAALFDRAKICVESFIKKEPRQSSNDIELHFDPSFTDESQFMCLNIWCPLTDVNANNGCLRVIPGSHHHGLALRPLSASGMVDHPFKEVMPLLWAKYGRDVEMAAGEALIFTGRLLHGSGPNRSDEERLVAGCEVVPQEAPILHAVSISPTEAELFEVDETFFWAHQLGTRPVTARRLDVVPTSKLVQFSKADVLRSPHLHRTRAFGQNWARWMHLMRQGA